MALISKKIIDLSRRTRLLFAAGTIGFFVVLGVYLLHLCLLETWVQQMHERIENSIREIEESNRLASAELHGMEIGEQSTQTQSPINLLTEQPAPIAKLDK